MLQVLCLVLESNGVFDVNLYRQSCTGFIVEFAHFTNMLEDGATQVLLDEEQQDIALGGQGQPEETLLGIDALTSRVVDDRAARCARFPGSVDHHVGLVVFDEDEQ